MIVLYILSRAKLQQHQVVPLQWEHLLEQVQVKQQEQVLVQVLVQALAHLVEWEELEQEWELNLILSPEWVEWAEWEAWEECQCSLVWQLVVVHPEWEEWVEQTWTPRWSTR